MGHARALSYALQGTDAVLLMLLEAIAIAVMHTPAPPLEMLQFDGIIHKDAFVATISPVCAQTDECFSMQRNAFDNLHAGWKFMTPERRAEVLKLVEKYTTSGYRNWYSVEYPPQPYTPPSNSVTCITSYSKPLHLSTTNCY